MLRIQFLRFTCRPTEKRIEVGTFGIGLEESFVCYWTEDSEIYRLRRTREVFALIRNTLENTDRRKGDVIQTPTVRLPAHQPSHKNDDISRGTTLT